MATRHKKTRAKPAKTNAPDYVRTQFITDFVAEFIRPSRTADFKWPSPELPRPAVLAEFEMFLHVLMTAAYLDRDPDSDGAPEADGTDALRDRLVKFLKVEDWPRSTPIPKKWAKIQPTVRLIEIAVLTDCLLEAINSHPTVCGAGASWPPHPRAPSPRPKGGG
jgi:hypothetical protein